MILKEIGKIKSPYKAKGEAPRQGKLSKETMILEILPEFRDAMHGLEEGHDIVVIYWGDRADRTALRTVPPGRDREYGVFATRSPNRPNPLALNVAKIISIDEDKLEVVGLDALDNSPLLDIKIYIPAMDSLETEKDEQKS